MKKYLIILLVIAMLSLCACSSEAEKDSTEANTLATEAIAETGPSGELIHEGSAGKKLFENDSCSITLQKAEIDSLSDYCWNVTLVNTSASTQIFTVENTFVNDIAIDPVWAVKIPAGATVEERIIWAAPELQERAITQVGRVDLKLRVFAENGTEFADADITCYPSGKSAYLPSTRNPQTTDVVLMDTADYTAIITGYNNEHRWGCALELYLYNKTDKAITINAENVLVSGCDCDPQWSITLPGGKQAYSEMIWFDEQLAEAGEITGVSFDLHVFDENGVSLTATSHVFVP